MEDTGFNTHTIYIVAAIDTHNKIIAYYKGYGYWAQSRESAMYFYTESLAEQSKNSHEYYMHSTIKEILYRKPNTFKEFKVLKRIYV